MGVIDEKFHNWTKKELERANQALNVPISRLETNYVIVSFLLVPFIVFVHSEIKGWPQSITGWLFFIAIICAFVLCMQFTLRVISIIVVWTPISIQHWIRVLLGVVLVPLAFWACMYLFEQLQYW